MITYQRTKEDTPQPVDEHGCLPDGTPVFFSSEGRVTFKEGTFQGWTTLFLDTEEEE